MSRPLPAAGAGVRALGRRVLRQRLAGPGLAVLVLVTAACLLAPVLVRTDPTAQDLGRRFEPPSLAAPLGTDHLGRDLLARVLHGGRNTLGGALLAVAVLSGLGLVIGGLAGYLGGLADALLMRATDAVLSFPYLVLALALAATFSPSLLTVVVAVALTWWGHYARVIRGMVLSLRETPYVEAARAVGAGPGHVLGRHVLPGILAPMIVLSTLDLGLVVLSVAALSYLGLGVQPPAPEWGMMLNESRLFMFLAPGLMLVPGFMIFVTVLAANLVGDALRDGLDPRYVGRRAY
jgi:ABC-type dipeptide/oligopeptide/nickel transport system permease subunit